MDRLWDRWTDCGQMDRLVTQKAMEDQWTDRQTGLMKLSLGRRFQDTLRSSMIFHETLGISRLILEWTSLEDTRPQMCHMY